MTPDEHPQFPPPRYAWYVVGVLTLAYVCSFVDRQILTLLVAPIRKDLGISDTQMGLLMGFSFAVFYTLFGLPVGRLVDSRKRRTIIAVGMALWSAMTAACGLARTYVQLLVVRMGVGVGEATLSPSAYSLLADYFPPERRTTAMSVYSMAIYLGSGLASVLGGLVVRFATTTATVVLPGLGSLRPWQFVFFLVGLPGVFLALLMFTVREPARQETGTNGPQVPLRVALRYIGRNARTFLHHNLGFALLSFSGYGAAGWVPTMFIRRFGWSNADIGVSYGVIVGIFGTLGILTGGWVGDRLRHRGKVDGNMWVGIVAAIGWLPFGLSSMLAANGNLAFWLLIPTVFFQAMPWGAAPAAIAEIMPNSLRGLASAIYLFTINLIGIGLGPTAVGWFTDHVLHNDKMVNISLAITTGTAETFAIILLFSGLGSFRKSVERLAQEGR